MLCVALVGCSIPADPDGTTDRVRHGVLRAGASAAGDMVVIAGDEVSGPLPELIESFATELGARVSWSVGSEEQLVDALERGVLDVAIGGMSTHTPWMDRASVTREYWLPSGESFVVLLPLGENRFQLTLETYLDGVAP